MKKKSFFWFSVRKVKSKAEAPQFPFYATAYSLWGRLLVIIAVLDKDNSPFSEGSQTYSYFHGGERGSRQAPTPTFMLFFFFFLWSCNF